ncbi:class I SAM-dependent methyltransferase [Roseiarcaceae bacterium H3SJ34-1]|uniref:methyltransferase regulatory domain-containing protein n=1 Tax=Terripilifer ovatus TaxID=3032367 RepID=UPI003AB9451A|nr:class I SAM-dependent methyltransferase [Roseiarcaceae bacterium H3SJ34-1]
MSLASALAPAQDVESMIARTALKYDLLPYTSNPFPQTQPARLAAIAHLFGLPYAPVEHAKVLELGCAAGGNIIPLASRFPDARFVGVDLSRTQVAAGRARIKDADLANIEIHCKSFTELGAEDGQFDYIICHGVYSWVPGPVREAILRICKERLSDVGIANISYNVLPGWRTLQALRDSFLLHVPDNNDSRSRVAKARELLAFLKDATHDTGVHKQNLQLWADRLAQLPDDYIAHEFLEETNEPCTFMNFVDAARRNGLGYLGESDLASVILDNLPAETAKRVRDISNNQFLAAEQYVDMLNGRTFRQSLLVDAQRAALINRNLSPAALAPLHFLTVAGMQLEHGQDGSSTLRDAQGRTVTTKASPLINVLERIASAFPGSFCLEDLYSILPAAARNETGRALVLEVVFKMVTTGILTALAAPVEAQTSAAGDRPVAFAIARLDASRGETTTTSLRHEKVRIDPFAQAILPLLDGVNDKAAIHAGVESALAQGRLTFHRDGKPMPAPEANAFVPELVDQMMLTFANAALLARETTGSARA